MSYNFKMGVSQGGLNQLILIVAVLSSIARANLITLEDVAASDYDYLHAPKNSSSPLQVNITISKISIRGIDDSQMTLSVTLELWQIWNDFRLRYPSWASGNSQLLDSSWINKIWNPKLYFLNAVDGKLDNIITPSSFFWLTRDRNVYYCCRVILTLICEMDLKYFPHDQQNCGIHMGSSTYSSQDILLVWIERTKDPALFSLQQFEVTDLQWKNFWKPFGYTNISCLNLNLVLNRRRGYFIINVYIPTVLIVIMSMLTFWIPADAVPARITLGVTSLLTIITKQYQSSTPNVSYIVALNVWLSSCIAFVFFSLLEFAAVIALNANKKTDKIQHHHHPDLKFPLVILRSNGTWSMKNSWPPKKQPEQQEKNGPVKLDYFSRVVFPISFIVFCIFYWYYYN